jgi:hypothetical protein
MYYNTRPKSALKGVTIVFFSLHRLENNMGFYEKTHPNFQKIQENMGERGA